MSLDLFIAAAGTEIGKTWLTEQLIGECRERGISCDALKPIITGYDSSPQTDTARLLSALDLPANEHTVAACSPWRFKEPLSPHMAASLEGRSISLSEVVEFCRQPSECRMRLIEGIGGVMVPVNQQHTTVDWMATLGIPAILVVGTYLGAISHGLTAYEVLRARGVTVQGIVVNESEEDAVPFDETVATFEQFCRPLPVAILRRVPSSGGFDSSGLAASLLEALQLLPA